jgi:hypothetical protein
MDGRRAFVLLTHRPHEAWLDFLQQCQSQAPDYEFYVVVDDYDFKTVPRKGITYVQISDAESERAGFTYSNFFVKDGRPSAWDKALYWACKQSRHGQVWFVEDDVYIPTFSVIKRLDQLYPVTDILSERNEINATGEIKWHYKTQADGIVSPPWAASMVCATRLSRRVLAEVDAWVANHKKLLFIELMFNTFAAQKGYTVATPPELKTIVYRYPWCGYDMDGDHLYHPVKKIEHHALFRRERGRSFVPAILVALSLGALWMVRRRN